MTPAALNWHTGHWPGLVGDVAALHGRCYARDFGFGPVFECQVAAGLADFMTRLDRPGHAIWSASLDAGTVGAIAVEADAGSARLRWFIVDDRARGLGVGRRLLEQALAFCDALGVADTQLWTFDGLDAARHLYESQGFVLAEQAPGTTWGTPVLEQRFVRRAPGPQRQSTVPKRS